MTGKQAAAPIHTYLRPVSIAFRAHGNDEKARGARAYMRNQFEFFGIPTPLRRTLTSQIFDAGLPALKDLPAILKNAWQQPEREFQYFAIELASRFKNDWDTSIVRDIEWLIVTKSWWDTVDSIAGWLAGPYFNRFPGQIRPVTGNWNQSDNIWLQRSSLLFQKSYKKHTNTSLLSAYILHLRDSREFFVQKAIGWALREYARIDPDWVSSFVITAGLRGLSRREALKHIR
jgi:3-methyladenine DNA glycosylase AlkD